MIHYFRVPVLVIVLNMQPILLQLQPLQQVEWFGNPRGYNISYREVGDSVSGGKWRSVTIDDHTANSHILENLEEFAQYEIITQAYNDVGSSKPSPIAVERTRESGTHLSSCQRIHMMRIDKHVAGCTLICWVMFKFCESLSMEMVKTK
jgi:hypothetical protein